MNRRTGFLLGIFTGCALAGPGLLYLHTTPDDAPIDRWLSAQTERIKPVSTQNQTEPTPTWDDIAPGWRVVVRKEDTEGRYDERGGIVDRHRYLRDVHGNTFIESYKRTGWTLVSAQPPAQSPAGGGS